MSDMTIRKADSSDMSRVAEIFVFNNRVNYLPIFGDPGYSFGELQVVSIIDDYFGKEEILNNLYVYDDCLIKGFVVIDGTEIEKLYVDTFFQNAGIGHALLQAVIDRFGADRVWALEKNVRAIAFYERHGFALSGKKKLEEGTTEYLVELKREK